MKVSNYKLAILFVVFQSILIAVLVNNNYMKSFSFLQSAGADLIEIILVVIAVLLNLLAVVVVRYLYLSGLESERLRTTALKYDHMVEQNQVYRQHYHDLKNHLIVVLGLLRQGKYTELKNYLDDYLRSINDALLKIETGLAEIDVLLSSKIHEARRKGILVDLAISSYIKCSRKNILDLVAIVANVFDNAIEANQDLELSRRKITFLLKKDQLDYIFEFSNPLIGTSADSPERFFKEGYSTKREGRGYGLFIVKRLNEKLEGNIDIDTSGGLFKATIQIPRHKLEE